MNIGSFDVRPASWPHAVGADRGCGRPYAATLFQLAHMPSVPPVHTRYAGVSCGSARMSTRRALSLTQRRAVSLGASPSGKGYPAMSFGVNRRSSTGTD